VPKKKRKNLHRDILEPFQEYIEALGATCQNYSIGRSMPRALKGHPDMVVFDQGTTIFIEVKPDKHGTARLTDGQCEWYHKFEKQFCDTIRYIIAGSYDELVYAFHVPLPVFLPPKHLRRLDRYAEDR
jgi:hypothetical protein